MNPARPSHSGRYELKKKSFLVFNFLLLTSYFLLPRLALADLPPGTAITFSGIDEFVRLILDFMMGISFFLMVIFIVISGIMTMAAGSDTTRFKNGLLRLKHAAIGAGVIMAAGVIIGTVYSLIDRSFFATCNISLVGICVY